MRQLSRLAPMPAWAHLRGEFSCARPAVDYGGRRSCGLLVIFTLAAPAYFVLQTLLADQLGAASMTAGLAVGVCLLTVMVTGLPRKDEIVALARAGGKAVIAGVLGVFCTQYLVLAHRYSDAPPGLRGDLLHDRRLGHPGRSRGIRHSPQAICRDR